MGFIHTRERCLTSNWLGNGSGRCQSWAAAAPVAIWINLGVLFQPFWNMCWAESCDSAQVDFCERCRRWRKNFLCFPFFFSSISLQSSSSLFPLCGCYLFCEEERWNDVTGEKKVYISFGIYLAVGSNSRIVRGVSFLWKLTIVYFSLFIRVASSGYILTR